MPTPGPRNPEPDPDPDSDRRAGNPALGRLLVAILVALVLMVAAGVLGIWRHAHREKAWRDRVTGTESFVTPTNH